MKAFKLVIICSLLLSHTACVPMFSRLETPSATLTGLRVLPGDSLVPTFEIGLLISNPNRIPLKLEGMTYAVYLEGEPVLRGVASHLPTIAAYGEGEVLLQARPDVFSTINLFNRWMNQSRGVFSYSFEAQLDVGRFVPRIKVVRSGEISLTQAPAR